MSDYSIPSPSDGIPGQTIDNQLYENVDISTMLTSLKRSKKDYTDYKLKENPRVIDKIIFSIEKDKRLKFFIDLAVKYIIELHEFTTRKLEMNDESLKEIEDLKSQLTSKSSNATQHKAILNDIFDRLKKIFYEFIDPKDENLKKYSSETREKATEIKNLINKMETQSDEKELSKLLSLIHSFMMDEKLKLLDKKGETIEALDMIDGLQFDSQKQQFTRNSRKAQFRNPLNAHLEFGVPKEIGSLVDGKGVRKRKSLTNPIINTKKEEERVTSSKTFASADSKQENGNL